MPTRRLLALIAMLALLAACACAALGWSGWRTRREAAAVAARLSPLPVAAPDPPPPPPGQPRTQAAVPAPSADSPAARRLDVAWQDGEGRVYRSRITLDGAKPARVETASDDRPLVSYRASVQRRVDGTLVIDASDAAVSGPAAAEWAADSFTIRADGSVTVQDGKHAPCAGYVVQESEQIRP